MQTPSETYNRTLQEVSHLVRNNLQVISSLLNLQIEFAGERSATEVMVLVNNRIQSIALLHDQFCQSGDLNFMDVSEYLRRVMKQTSDAVRRTDQEIELITSLDPMQVSLDFLMPLGLMINELVLNSIVHGQPVASTNQRLKLEGNKKRHCYELTFSDNGPGFDYSEKKLKAGLGLRFLNGLASQLKADVQFSFSRGSVCKIRLPLA